MRERHTKRLGEREQGVPNPIDLTLVLNPNTVVFYICLCVQPLTKDICRCNIHFNTTRGQVKKNLKTRINYLHIYYPLKKGNFQC